jgi:hypothetical protein
MLSKLALPKDGITFMLAKLNGRSFEAVNYNITRTRKRCMNELKRDTGAVRERGGDGSTLITVLLFLRD